MKARVFLSSAIAEFRQERQIAKSLVSTFSFLEMWVFEDEGASSASLEQSYQAPLEKGDVVIFLLGADITEPVLGEVDAALRLNKRTLVILRDVPHRSQALKAAIRRLDVKYATYAGPEDFSAVLHDAIDAEIVGALQAPPQRTSSDPKYQVLKNAFAQSAELRLEPLVGPNSDNRFRIRELTASEAKVQKCNSEHLVAIPLSSVAEAFQDGIEFTVSLNGRIQWLTNRGFYKFFPSQPKDDWGIPKMSSPGSQDVVALQGNLRTKGYYTQWNVLPEVRSDGYEVAYDDDGKYFRCDGRIRPGSVEILVARR